MEEIFFPTLGMDFSELRQIALTFCHRFVNRFHPVLPPPSRPAMPTHFIPLHRPVAPCLADPSNPASPTGPTPGKLVSEIARTAVVLRMKQIAIFASGAGSNAARIIDHFQRHTKIKVALIVCNRPDAGVLRVAGSAGIPTLLIEKEPFFGGDAYVGALRHRGIDFIVLAGFLWKIPPALIRAYPGKIVNLHPALLPKYGGKGMYGRYVHEAVIAAGEKLTGISIHYVDELYDHGQVLFQVSVAVEAGDTAAMVAEKVQQLEHQYFPEVIEKVVGALVEA